MVRLRSAPAPRQSMQHAQAERQALKEKTNTSRTKAAVYENDGNTEDLVKDKKPRSTRKAKTGPVEDEFIMAGGLGEASDKVVAPPSETIVTTDELAKSDAPPPVAKTNRRPPRMTKKIVQSEAQSKVMDGLKKRMAATARKEAGKAAQPPADDEIEDSSNEADEPAAPQEVVATVEQSDLSLSSSPPPSNQNSVQKGRRLSLVQPGSALRSHGTPAAAVETSMLALKNFKRRPRQLSMLAMIQKRTGAGQQSEINNTGLDDGESAFDLAPASDEEEDDFAPDAEGTPLNVNKTKMRQSMSASKKRKSGEMNTSTALEALQAKRRKSTAEDDSVVNTQRVRSSMRSAGRRSTAQSQDISDVQVSNTPLESSPPRESLSPDRDAIVPSTAQQDLNNADLDPNDTMAEPASSSPPPPSSAAARQHAFEMAEPLTQLSPRPERKAAATRKPKPMTTAILQNLLPKRRQPLKPRQRKSDYDISSDSEDMPQDHSRFDQEEDELHVTPARKSKATKTKKAPAKGKGKIKAAAKKPTKTYGRKSAAAAPDSDQENHGGEDGEDGSSADMPEVSMYEAAQSRELEEAKRKFAELDAWDMEFENMDREEHRSSSQQWR